MTGYIDQIEKFLRGQMGQGEEIAFKSSLATDAYLRSLSFVVVFITKAQKSW